MSASPRLGRKNSKNHVQRHERVISAAGWWRREHARSERGVAGLGTENHRLLHQLPPQLPVHALWLLLQYVFGSCSQLSHPFQKQHLKLPVGVGVGVGGGEGPGVGTQGPGVGVGVGLGIGNSPVVLQTMFTVLHLVKVYCNCLPPTTNVRGKSWFWSRFTAIRVKVCAASSRNASTIAGGAPALWSCVSTRYAPGRMKRAMCATVQKSWLKRMSAMLLAQLGMERSGRPEVKVTPSRNGPQFSSVTMIHFVPLWMPYVTEPKKRFVMSQLWFQPKPSKPLLMSQTRSGNHPVHSVKCCSLSGKADPILSCASFMLPP